MLLSPQVWSERSDQPGVRFFQVCRNALQVCSLHPNLEQARPYSIQAN